VDEGRLLRHVADVFRVRRASIGRDALLHPAGRNGGRIVERGIAALVNEVPASSSSAYRPVDLWQCYEVSADVYAQMTGRDPGSPRSSTCAAHRGAQRAWRTGLYDRHARDATTIDSSPTALDTGATTRRMIAVCRRRRSS
jgi:hypothetical protein